MNDVHKVSGVDVPVVRVVEQHPRMLANAAAPGMPSFRDT